jgi:hypothetical protein
MYSEIHSSSKNQMLCARENKLYSTMHPLEEDFQREYILDSVQIHWILDMRDKDVYQLEVRVLYGKPVRLVDSLEKRSFRSVSPPQTSAL